MLELTLYQSYFNPSNLALFKLFWGGRNARDLEIEQSFNVQQSMLQLVHLPLEFKGQSWRQLVAFLTASGVVPIGLLREAGSFDNRLPFVYTNPLGSVLLVPSDRVFLLSSRRIIGLKKNEKT